MSNTITPLTLAHAASFVFNHFKDFRESNPVATKAEKRKALRGYLLALAVRTEHEELSAEDVFDAFAEDYDDFSDFDVDFGLSLTWLRDEGLVRFEALPSGTNGETTVVGLSATSAGDAAVRAAEDRELPVPSKSPERKGFAVEVAKVFGAFVGEFVNTQK